MDQNQIFEMPQEFYVAEMVTTTKHYTKSDMKFINEYELKDTLGKGSYGKVKRVTRAFTDEGSDIIKQDDYAMKIFNVTVLQNRRTCFYEDNGKVPRMTNQLEFAMNEINIWKYLDDPHICKVYQILEDEQDDQDCIYMVMQLGDQGTLMDYDFSQNNFMRNPKVMSYFQSKLFPDIKYTPENLEIIAAYVFKQVAEGIKYLHTENIVNRDIKVDNIVCSSQYELLNSIKLIDFSTSREVKNKNSRLFDCAGTPGFRDPEQQFALEDGYLAMPCDIWSFGICLFCFLNEQLPFWADSELEIDLKARKDSIQFRPHNSELVQDLINQCCAKNPIERPTIEQVLQHSWFD